MFHDCFSLRYLDISGFITEEKINIFNYLNTTEGCEIKMKKELANKINKNPGCTLIKI